ncbi:AraC family transcriptional regulator [Flagellimonas myxillae]|uniref:AraC family transcriptional regulator n=1 Tax=Flagellimonas myxillae TaxID=2942214 RepID=UPI00201E8980|nr:AraC family transcriptional regulator [Muricauda myxillae]MCL6268226.1 AraC family transcriptional regulator [Muricauda myxillae]
MKLQFVDRSSLKDNSFSVKHNHYPYFLRLWHYHPELELVYISKSEGTRFIGDSIERFRGDEVFLLGANLPHMWLNDERYFGETSDLFAEAYSIHFRQDFLGGEFFNAPELKQINDLVLLSQQGIKFDDLDIAIKQDIMDLVDKRPFEKLISLFAILHALSKHPKKTLLASKGYLNTFKGQQGHGMDKTYEFIFKNFNKSITLNEVAEVASMNPSAFSRFFKKVNRKTFKEYLNELRVGYACKLISEDRHNITRICFESGYNNISNFNRQFKRITGKSPSQYRKQYLQA